MIRTYEAHPVKIGSSTMDVKIHGGAVITVDKVEGVEYTTLLMILMEPGTRIAKQVIHKRDGPKLPHQTVVIQQSAMHLKDRNALLSEGGVDPHTGSGPIPVFLFCGCDSQAGKYRG